MKKIALITGAANGIGFCTAAEFLKNGYEVIAIDKDMKSLLKSVPELKTLGTVHHFQADVSDHEETKKLKKYITEFIGKVDVLINNAGIGHNGEIAETSIEKWKQLINVNLLGPIYYINEYLPDMIKDESGTIVNVSSGQFFYRLPTWCAYASIKAALSVMSEALSVELSKHNVNVITAYPFMVDTGFYSDIEGETFAGKIAMKTVPYYSNKPQTVAKKIYKAVENNKKIEMINPLNYIGMAARSIPPISNIFSKMTNFFLVKR